MQPPCNCCAAAAAEVKWVTRGVGASPGSEARVEQGGSNGRVARPSAGTALPVVPGSCVGIVANPMSGRDIRRLVAQASVFPNAEKTNMALRLVAAAGATGVARVLMSTDGMGVAAGVVRARDKRRPGAVRGRSWSSSSWT